MPKKITSWCCTVRTWQATTSGSGTSSLFTLSALCRQWSTMALAEEWCWRAPLSACTSPSDTDACGRNQPWCPTISSLFNCIVHSKKDSCRTVDIMWLIHLFSLVIHSSAFRCANLSDYSQWLILLPGWCFPRRGSTTSPCFASCTGSKCRSGLTVS